MYTPTIKSADGFGGCNIHHDKVGQYIVITFSDEPRGFRQAKTIGRAELLAEVVALGDIVEYYNSGC